MFPPGWNISEPIELAHRLYLVVEALRSAPESAKAFVSKIKNFSANLSDLQEVLESDTAGHSLQDPKRLCATVTECQACVKRCEEFSEGFGKLTKDGRGKMDGAGQAVCWTLQDKKVARLREEIDGRMKDIEFALAIMNFADGRRRHSSCSTTESFSPPLRSGTLTSLPPYSSPQPSCPQTEDSRHAKTPSDLLGLDIDHTRKTSDTEVLDFQLGTSGIDGRGLFTSPQASPNTLRLFTEQTGSSELESIGDRKPLERRRNTVDEVATSPNGLGIFGAISEGSSPMSRGFTTPTHSSPRTSTTAGTSSISRRDSVLSLESAVLEMIMENLSGVRATYYKAKSRISYRISTIESFRVRQTGRRYIIISPPPSSNIKLYFVPPIDRIIPHSEHPQAYGSTIKHRVKFIEPYLLRSQKTSSERQTSDASSIVSPSLTPVSSAASVASSRSLGSPIITTDTGVLKEESQHQEYDFENVDDYRRFQELLMGPDVKLRFQVPILSITAKKYEGSKPTKESQLQYLRLWQFGGRQTMMFFANVSSCKYREYGMENLRPMESKSKTTIRLDVHLPGMVRRRSSSKSPLIIAKPSTLEQARFGGDADGNDMTDLDYLSIEFSCAKDKAAFLGEANFHGLGEEALASPSARLSKSPP